MQNLNRKKNQQMGAKYNLGNQDIFIYLKNIYKISRYIHICIILLPSYLIITVIYFVYPDLDLPRSKPSELKQTHHLLGDKYWGDSVFETDQRETLC